MKADNWLMYLCPTLHSADMLSTVTFVYGRALISLRADFTYSQCVRLADLFTCV